MAGISYIEIAKDLHCRSMDTADNLQFKIWRTIHRKWGRENFNFGNEDSFTGYEW